MVGNEPDEHYTFISFLQIDMHRMLSKHTSIESKNNTDDVHTCTGTMIQKKLKSYLMSSETSSPDYSTDECMVCTVHVYVCVMNKSCLANGSA